MRIWYNFTKIWYNFKHGIINLIIWFPVIWKNRDWDYCFLYKIMKKKLEMMENLQRFHGHHVDDVAMANQMKACIVLIDRLIEDDYNSICFDDYFNKWGHPYYVEENHKFGMRKEKDIATEEDKIQKKKEFYDCINKEYELKLNDKKELGRIIIDNIDSWWD